MIRLRLMVVTDRRLAGSRSVREVVEAALAAGAQAIQLRDKQASARELYLQATELLPLVHGHLGFLIINDRIDVALAAGADGVHLGPDDIPVATARRIGPPDFLIGASTDDPCRARELERAGASYIGCGAVFGTSTKDVGKERIGPERVREVASAVRIPVVAIGGITPDNVAQLGGTGVAGVAVVGAVMAASDPGEAVRRLLATNLQTLPDRGPGELADRP